MDCIQNFIIKYWVKKLIEPLIERAKARANLQGREWFSPSEWPTWMDSRPISEGVIAEIVAKWTGIPITRIISSEKAKLLHLEDQLQK